MILSLCCLKGGVGKTCLAVHLAHAIALSKHRVILIDCDPQASASGWAAARSDASPFPVVGMARETLHRDLPPLVADYDHAVLDTPPRVSALARSAILASSLILIPVQPSSYDVWAAGETVELVKEAQQFKPEIKATFVINRRIGNTAIGRDIDAALEGYPFPTMKTAIAQRVAFAESSAGYTVMEMAPKSAASKEILTWSKEVLKFAGLKTW